MVCLQSTDMGTRICLAAEGFGNRHCFLENIADKNIPPELSSCVFVIEQALSVRALQEMITAKQKQQQATSNSEIASGGATGGAGSSAGNAVKNAEDGMEGGAGVGTGGGGSASGTLNGGSSSSGGSGRETAATGGSRTLLYGHAVLLRHGYSKMHLACLSSTSSSSDKLAFDVGLQEQNQGHF
jgi:hypothetical protein